MKNKNLILISGRISSGKDTVASIWQWLSSPLNLQYSFETWNSCEFHDKENTPYEVKKFAGKLKEIATMLTGIPTKSFEDQAFKQTYLGPEWDGMLVRLFLQKLGTEAMREGLHVNTWINAMYADWKEGESKWLITDNRFPNEDDSGKERNAIRIRVVRPDYPEKILVYSMGQGKLIPVAFDKTSAEHMGIYENVKRVKEKNLHISETALDHVTDWDEVIVNDGSIGDLVQKVQFIMLKYGVIPRQVL